MHSIDENGEVCVNLDDYCHLSDSIKYRKKIDQLMETFHCPKDISNFSVSIFMRGGRTYYISNLYLWAIPYLTEGLCRGDVDHERAQYHGKEFFIQRDIQYDAIQTSIVQVLESRYNLSTTFAMVRQCPDCDFIIETYNNTKVADPAKLYHHIRDDLEAFICHFLDAMQEEILSALPEYKWLPILNDPQLRKRVITRQAISEIQTVLTPREQQCLFLISQGRTTKEVAEQLFISCDTVTTHAKSIRQKLGCKNIAEAVSKALKHGFI